jgi:hypothetical protein
MTHSDPEALDPELAALLRADFAPASAVSKERVSSRLVQSVGLLAPGQVAGPARVQAAANSSASLIDAFRAHPLGFIGSFVLGAALGSGVCVAARGSKPASIVYVDRPVAPAPPVPNAPTVPLRLEDVPSPPPAKAVTSVAPTPSVALEHGESASLAEQQALLDLARSAFARSDYAATLQALSAHFRRYPKSILGEEREALEIKALAASGRDTEARARAARFKAQFPQSLLLPSVTDSVGAIP